MLNWKMLTIAGALSASLAFVPGTAGAQDRNSEYQQGGVGYRPYQGGSYAGYGSGPYYGNRAYYGYRSGYPRTYYGSRYYGRPYYGYRRPYSAYPYGYRYGYRSYDGGALAAGVIGGALLGSAIANARPAYASRCWRQRKPVQVNGRWVRRLVTVCNR